MTGPLRVGMNLLWLRPGIVGGTEVAAVSTVDALGRHAASDVDLHLYAQTSFREAHPETAGRLPTRTVDVPGGNRVTRVGLESTWLPSVVHRDRIDVVHCYGGVVPQRLGLPSVLTIHDVQPLESGAHFGAIKKRWLTHQIPASIARAGAVAVPSEFVRARILERLHVAPEKLVVVPHGVDSTLSVDTDGLPDPRTMRQRFGLSGPFVLYPAITYPHKNHERLIEAFARVARRSDAVTLVLAGGEGPAESTLAPLIERLGIGDRVRRVGRIGHTERDVLLREAAVVAFPSRYEGFGLPVLEAMAVDTPVVASSAGSLPEVVGDAGVLVAPDDVDTWAEALEAAISGADSSPDASARRATQAARFSWASIVPRLVDLYRRVAPEAVGRP